MFPSAFVYGKEKTDTHFLSTNFVKKVSQGPHNAYYEKCSNISFEIQV